MTLPDSGTEKLYNFQKLTSQLPAWGCSVRPLAPETPAWWRERPCTAV